MLLVKTYVGKSEIHGIGLFAAEHILAGTLIWKFRKDFEQVFKKEDVLNLPEPARDYVLNQAYVNARHQVYILCTDNERFVNHSDDPNTVSLGFRSDIESGEVYALRDIVLGEEITEDYNCYDESGRILLPMETEETMKEKR